MTQTSSPASAVNTGGTTYRFKTMTVTTILAPSGVTTRRQIPGAGRKGGDRVSVHSF